MSKRGENIWKRKDGRWEGRYIKYRTSDGKAIYGSVYAKTYTEVKLKKEAAIASCQTERKPTFPANSIACVLKEYLSEHQFAIKKSSYARYVEMADSHVIPDIGNINIGDFTQDQANAYVIHLQSMGKLNGGGLAPKTVKDIVSFLKLVFKYAEKKSYISTGAVSFTVPKQGKSQIQVLNAPQQERLEKYVCSISDPCKFGVYLCLYTGLRIGELCALR